MRWPATFNFSTTAQRSPMGVCPSRNSRALIALGDLVREANAVADPMGPPVRLEVQAFEASSFDVTLLISTADAMTFVAASLEIINLFASSLTIVQWLHGRQIESKDSIDPNTTRIRTKDGDEITVGANASALIERKGFWRWSRTLVRPLKEDGLESLTIKPEDPTVEPVVITKADIPSLKRERRDRLTFSTTRFTAFLV